MNAGMSELRINELAPALERAEWLKQKANWIRMSAMTMTHHAHLGHTGGDLSAADILAVLYLGGILHLDPSQPLWPQRDRFILSKGHCSAALYSTLALRGFFPIDDLKTHMDPLSMFNGHPDRNKLPGVEANTGPLGHGCRSRLALHWRPHAQGVMARVCPHRRWRVAGRLKLGSGHDRPALRLDSLTVIVDRNMIQQGDFTENTIRMELLRSDGEPSASRSRKLTATITPRCFNGLGICPSNPANQPA